MSLRENIQHHWTITSKKWKDEDDNTNEATQQGGRSGAEGSALRQFLEAESNDGNKTVSKGAPWLEGDWLIRTDLEDWSR